jgi:hypothetical protein
MKQIVASCSLFSIVAFTVLFAVGATESSEGSNSAAPVVGKVARYGNADSISEEEMKIYDYFLASDQLEGRNFPSRGYDAAALYVASHLAEWGLKSGGSTENTNGPLQPYLMPFELVSRQVVTAETKASLTAPAPVRRGGLSAPSAPRTTELQYGKDWTMGGGGFRGPALGESFDVSGRFVFAGNGYVINKSKINPYEGLDVRGKIVVVAGLPPEIAAQRAAAAARGGRGADMQNPLGEHCVDYLTPEEYAAKNGALAVIAIADFQQLSAMASPNPAASFNGPSFQVTKFQDPPACPIVPSVVAGLQATNLIFQDEKMNAAQVFYAAGTNTKLDSLELNAEKKLSLHVVIRSEPGHGENVVGMLEGDDPLLKHEYVVISAHLDHIGLSAPLPDGHNVNNGADDDGSGSTGLLAIARSYAQGAAKGIRPKRTIIFLWNGGEEKGLWGSRYFNQFPPVDLTKVVANLNMDMIGRTKSADFSDPDPTHLLVKPGEVLVVGPQVSSDDLETIVETVNGSYQKLALNHFYDATAPDATHDNLGPKPNGQRIFYRSDHYNFAKMGIPIAFFTIGLHPDYHRPTDTPEKIDYKEIQVISKTVAAVAWVLGNQAGRPKLKASLPDQLVKDMKSAQAQGWGKITPVLAPLPGEPY